MQLQIHKTNTSPLKIHRNPRRKVVSHHFSGALGPHLSGSVRALLATKWRSYWEEELQNANATPGDGVESNEVTWLSPQVPRWILENKIGRSHDYKSPGKSMEIYLNRGLKRMRSYTWIPSCKNTVGFVFHWHYLKWFYFMDFVFVFRNSLVTFVW